MNSNQLTQAIIKRFDLIVASWLVKAGVWKAKVKRRTEGVWLIEAQGKSRGDAITNAVDLFFSNVVEWRLETLGFDGAWYPLGSHIDNPSHARVEAKHIAAGLEPMTFRVMMVLGDRGSKTATEVDRFDVRKELES